MFDHIGVVVSDFAKSNAFYAQALAPIGHSRVVEIMVDGGRKPSAGFCHEDGSDLWFSQGEPTRPLHIAFRVNSRAAVDAFHGAALGVGRGCAHQRLLGVGAWLCHPRFNPEALPLWGGVPVRAPRARPVGVAPHRTKLHRGS